MFVRRNGINKGAISAAHCTRETATGTTIRRRLPIADRPFLIEISVLSVLSVFSVGSVGSVDSVAPTQ